MGRIRSEWLFFFCVTVVLFVFFIPAQAQTVSGVITGTVVDSTGAAIPGAAVDLINEDTGDKRSAFSDSGGGFVYTAVLPGRYTVAVEAKGFKRYERKRLTITASERLAVGTLALEVGALTESVTITAQGTPVQTASQERSALLTNTQMGALMSRSRDFVSLLRVLPGVVSVADPDTMTRSQGPNMQGLRSTFNSLTIDGLMGNDLGSPEWLGSPMNIDAIAEVKVLLNNYQAEYGRNAGAVVNAITKSGTRDFHGTGYYYKRHEQFNANSFFNNRNNVAKPRYRFSSGGYNLGGPVYVPGKFNTNKEKLFFFFSQEILRTEAPRALQLVTMPTELERKGDFSQTLDLAGTLVRIRDPLAAQPFPNNVVPTSRININGQKLLGAFPIPNMLDRGVTRGNYNYTFQESLFSPKSQEVFRFDYNATSRMRMYFRGTTWREDDQGYNVAAGAAAWGMIAGHYKYTDKSAVYNMTYMLSSTMVNEFSLGAHRNTENGPPRSQEDIDKYDRAKLGMTLGQFYPKNNPYNLIPWTNFGGVPSAANFTMDGRFPVAGADTVFSLTDGLSKVWNNHTLKMGVFMERDRNYEGAHGTFAGSFNFSRDVNNPDDSNWAYSNALLGNFSSYEESDTRPETQGRAFMFEWYVQDNWKVNRRLTLDYGIRFSTSVPLWQADGRAAAFSLERVDPKKVPMLFQPVLSGGARVARNPLTGAIVPAVMIGAVVPNSGDLVNGMVLATDSNYPKGFVNSQGVVYGPRVGFAYDPFGNGKTSVRGGIGMFYNNLVRGGINRTLTFNPPVRFTPVIYYGNMSTFLNSAGVMFPSSVAGFARSGELPTVYSFSLGVQRDVGFNTVLDVAYVGSLGRHLLQQRDLNMLPYGKRFQASSIDPTNNRPFPDNFLRPLLGYGAINYMENASTSNFHSLQVQANRRFAQGLQFGLAWTWSKAMDFTDGDAGTVATYAPLRVWNYGKAGFDRTHNLVINWVWDVPKGSHLSNTRPVRAILDNWQVSGIASFVSGAPTGVGFSTVDTVDLNGGGDGTRIIVTAKAPLPRSERTFDRYFNTGAFARPPVGSPGNAPKDVFRGPGINNWDLSIFKSFPIRERTYFQFRWEMYNAFNHTQYSSVDTTARFDAAGNQVNTRFGGLTASRDPRRMQLSLRFNF